MKEVVVKTGAIRSAKLQSNRHHKQINNQHFTGLDGPVKCCLPVAQPTMSQHRRKIIHYRINGKKFLKTIG